MSRIARRPVQRKGAALDRMIIEETRNLKAIELHEPEPFRTELCALYDQLIRKLLELRETKSPSDYK